MEDAFYVIESKHHFAWLKFGDDALLDERKLDPEVPLLARDTWPGV